MASRSEEVELELLPFLRKYKDGSIVRLISSPYVPPTPEDPETGVATKDITISKNPPISARLFLPKLYPTHQKKLPVMFYCRGGGFVHESAFSLHHFRYLNCLVSEAQVVGITVEYRQAPEHFLPTAYEDVWAGLKWVASHSLEDTDIDKDPWLVNHGNFERFFLGGDSAGANVAHNILLRAGVESLPGNLNISAAYLTHPYFWGSKAVRSEPTEERQKLLHGLVWEFAYPGAPGGVDNPMINPMAPDAPSLAGLATSRLLVSVAGKDELCDRGVAYYEAVVKSGWKGEAELVEVEGEEHAFQIVNFGTQKGLNLIKRVAAFLLRQC